MTDDKRSLLTTCTLNSMFILILALMTSMSRAAEIKLSPQWTERYLFKNTPQLLENSHADHVLAFYYFGGFKDFTVMGMERVRGEDYEPHNTILIFKNSILQGYYEELLVFPAGVSEEGLIFFPANRSVNEQINLATDAYPALIFNEDPETASIYTRLKP